MIDWKEGLIKEYHILESGKQMVEEEMVKNHGLSQLRLQIEDVQRQLIEREKEYRADIHDCEWAMQKIREDLIERWDIEDKSFRCNRGSISIRTTRSLKVDNKAKLINILQQIGKLTQCIKGWDITYLRKLGAAGLFDVGVGDTNIVHYDEKRRVIISAIEKGGGGGDEE